MNYLNKVKIICIEKQLSISELAKNIGVSRVTLYNKLKIADKKMLEKIENYLDVKL